MFSEMEALGIFDPSESQDPEILSLYKFWLEGRDEEGWFLAKNFDVLDLPRSLLPHINLIKVHHHDRTFEVRIVGQHVITQGGLNTTGRFIHEIEGAETTQKRAEFCVDFNLPYAASGKITWGPNRFNGYAIGTVPLHNEEGKVSHLLSVMVIKSPTPQTTTALYSGLSSSNLPADDYQPFNDAFLYWQNKRSDVLVPLRSSLDPLDIHRLLPCVMLSDVHSDPLDFEHRIIGEIAKSILPSGNVGARFSELSDRGPDSPIWDIHKTVTFTGIPRYGEIAYTGPEPDIDSIITLLLPFSDDGKKVTSIMAIIAIKET